jgi:outer membrane biosynthesis protein TonB
MEGFGVKRWIAIAVSICAASCSSAPKPDAKPPAQESSQPPENASTAATQSAPAPTASPSDPAPIPPLSSPNEKPAPTATTSPVPEDEPGIPHVDPRMTALRRAGESAQACYAQAGLPAGTSGKLFVRITLAADGSVQRAEIDRSRSAAKLTGGKLEQCVLAAVEQQTFPAPRSGTDVTLEMPLDFQPSN